MEEFKVRITAVSERGFWYRDLIGKIFSVTDRDKYYYQRVDDNAYMIRREDCEIVSNDREEEFKVGDRVEVTIHNQLARIGMTGILYRKKGENDEVWNDSTRKWIVTFDDNIGSKNVPGNTPGHDYYMPEENLKQTNKPIKEESNMSEATVTIGSIFLEVFENGKDAKRMSDRFGEQYGENPDRDLVALENDKGKLTRILEDEEEKEEAARVAKKKK